MPKMPPPGSDGPGLVIAVQGPARSSKSGASRMPPPGTPERDPGTKVPREEAGFVGSDSHCVDCANWSPESGECVKVEGIFDPEDACIKWFEPEHSESGETPGDESMEAVEASEGQRG